jgi:RNA polymerase sigma factor (sigma-70 family)
VTIYQEVRRVADSGGAPDPWHEESPIDFSAWVAARGPALQRFAYLVCGDQHAAGDLVQDALMRAWPKWPELSKRGTIEAYVRRSIVNGSISSWRKQRRMVVVSEPQDLHAAPLSTTGVPGESDATIAWELCADLPPAQRAALVLRFHDDLGYPQIAELLDCTESTARSHVHRGVLALRGRLGSEEETS